MSSVLPADKDPFEHEQVVAAGFDDPLRLAYSHRTPVLEATRVVDPSYIYTVRERLGYTCPDCDGTTVEPRQQETRTTIAQHVHCTGCDWGGTRGDMERQQITTFVPHLSPETTYSLWKEIGSISALIETGEGRLRRELEPVLEDPIETRETAMKRTPDPLQPTPPPLTERFDVDAAVVADGVDVLRSETPYDDGRLEQFVRVSYAAQQLRPQEEALIEAQDGIGLIDGALQQRPITSSDEAAIENGYDRIRRAIKSFVDANSFESVQEAIITVRAGFEPRLHRRIRSDVLAQAVGCNSGYAAEFELATVEPFPIVLKKDYVASREVQPLTEAHRTEILDRDEGCQRCGAANDLDVHHIIPVAQGGETTETNLAALCRDCHRAAHGGSFGPTVVYDSFASWVSKYDG